VGSVRLATDDFEQPQYVTPAQWSVQPYENGSSGSVYVNDPAPPRRAAPFGLQFRYRFDAPDSFYKGNYHTLAGFLPFHINPGSSLFFVEARGFATDGGNTGGNAGAGIRYYSAAQNRMYSLSGWYDYDATNIKSYDRVGISLASLTDQGVDFRANGYIALDDDRQFISRTTGIPVFEGYNIAQATDTLTEVPFSGFDGEFGIPLPFLGAHSFKGYAGMYYYTADGEDDAVGPRLRIDGQLTPSIWGQVMWMDDTVFGSNIIASVSLDLPGGGFRPVLAPKPTRAMLSQQVLREYRVAVQDRVTRVASVAINPTDLEPFRVYHVDNTATAGGDGSFESPDDTLPLSVDPNFDIIFVNRGDETSRGYTGGFELQDDQRLLGEGTMHYYTSTEGTFMLPGYTPGVNPLITDTIFMGSGPESVFDFTGDRTEVAGFRIAPSSPLRDGIWVSADDFLIREVDIVGGNYGINVVNATGFGEITDANISDTETFDGITVDQTDGSTLDLLITDTTVTDPIDDGISFWVTTGSSLFVTMDNVTVTGALDDGLSLESSYFNSTLDVEVSNSTFSDNGGDGAHIRRVNDSGIAFTAFSSFFERNGGDGVDLESLNGRVPNGMLNLYDSFLNDNTLLGLRLRGEADVTLDVNLIRNEINRNGFGGIQMTSFEYVELRGLWRGNEINDNGFLAPVGDGDGIYLGSNTDLVLTDNDVIGNNGDGLQVEIFGSALVLLDMNGNWIEDNNGYGFDFDSTGASTLLMDVDASDTRISRFNSNLLDGVELRAQGDGAHDNLFVTIDNTEVNFNGDRGIDILSQVDGDTSLYLNESQVSANGEEGIYVVNTSSATQTQDVSSSDALLDDGGLFDDPTTVLYIEDSEIDANGEPGTMGGVVIRVGTSDGTTSPSFEGGFASDGFGGVRAGLVDTMLSGNYGDDVVIETYVSTIDPATGTTWSDVEYDPTGYESDPLARIDMVFTGVTADTINVTQFGAFYDTADPVFKSRDVDQTDPGPFDMGGDRRRNATRLAFRGGAFSTPATPGGASDLFKYPGVGTSVMRIESDFDQSGVDGIITGFNTAVGFPGPVQTGELSFYWETVPPGTVFP